MSDNVIRLPTADIPPDEVLENAKGFLDVAIVVGTDRDSKLYFAGSTANLVDVHWLLSVCQDWIMQNAREE